MRAVAITGIGGPIGLRLAGRLRASGVGVRGLERSAAAAARAAAVGCRVWTRDVTDRRALEELCRGVDAVVHTAAPAHADGGSGAGAHPSVSATRALGSAARACGVRRMVHLSSVAVYGLRYPHMVDEEGARPGRRTPIFGAEIFESEQAALRMHDDGFEVVVLRPGDVYGPGSMQWVVHPIQLMERRLFMLPDAGAGLMNHLYVDNLVDAVMLALETPHSGFAYNLTDGASTTFADYFGRLALMSGHPLPPTVPGGVARAVARGLGEGTRLLGRSLPHGVAALELLTRRHPYSTERARTLLGFKPRVDLDQGLQCTERWLRAEGVVPRRLRSGTPSRAGSAPRLPGAWSSRIADMRSIASRAAATIRR